MLVWQLTPENQDFQENILGVHELLEKCDNQKLSAPDEKYVPVSYEKVHIMKTAFNLIFIVLLVSLIISLFMSKHESKKRT